jgi:RNA polymerase sigma-70 factor (ECF subfamily)
LFSSNATLYSDGGGKAAATLNPIYGAEKIARFFIGVRDKAPAGAEILPRLVNGSLGYVVFVGEQPIQANHFEFDGDRITAVHIVRNPDKLRHLTRT